jgi:hypothetical protein
MTDLHSRHCHQGSLLISVSADSWRSLSVSRLLEGNPVLNGCQRWVGAQMGAALVQTRVGEIVGLVSPSSSSELQVQAELSLH